MRSAQQPLRLDHLQLVVYPTVPGVELERGYVIGGNLYLGRAGHTFEVLRAPGIGFNDRHGTSFSCGPNTISGDCTSPAAESVESALPTATIVFRDPYKFPSEACSRYGDQSDRSVAGAGVPGSRR